MKKIIFSKIIYIILQYLDLP